ncbi:MAG: transposase [Salibacteraceae bacterium]|jgi:transposase
MKRHFDNEFNTMIAELLTSGKTAKEVSEEYNIQDGLIRRWRIEYEAKSGDFSKKRAVSAGVLELKRLRKELQETKLERDILNKAVSTPHQ